MQYNSNFHFLQVEKDTCIKSWGKKKKLSLVKTNVYKCNWFVSGNMNCYHKNLLCPPAVKYIIPLNAGGLDIFWFCKNYVMPARGHATHRSFSYPHLSCVWEYRDTAPAPLPHPPFLLPLTGLIPPGSHILWWSCCVCVCLSVCVCSGVAHSSRCRLSVYSARVPYLNLTFRPIISWVFLERNVHK